MRQDEVIRILKSSLKKLEELKKNWNEATRATGKITIEHFRPSFIQIWNNDDDEYKTSGTVNE